MIESIFNEINQTISKQCANFVIQAGYFETNYGAGDFSCHSLASALALADLIKNDNKSNKVNFSILVNDFGQSCDEPVCTINTENKAYNIQQEVDGLLNKFNVNPNDFLITKESTLKNRGLRKIRRLLKNEPLSVTSLLYNKSMSNNWYMRSKFSGEINLFEKHDNNLIAKCPVIMGAYYSDMLATLEKKFNKSSAPIVVIDFCSYSDKDKVNRGVEVAFGVFKENQVLDREYYLMPILSDTKCERLILNTFCSKQFL